MKDNPQSEIRNPQLDSRYYLACPLRKNKARIPVTVCIRNGCTWLCQDAGRSHCDYPTEKPKVARIDRDPDGR